MDTPYLRINASLMRTNLTSMAKVAADSGVRLRPHAKTHKIPQLARLQLESGASGITAAKVSEAEVMAQHGIADIFIAYPLVTPSKISRALHLAKSIRLIVGVDSLAGARRLAEAARQTGQTLEVRLEVDTGLGRTGVPYKEAPPLARAIGEMTALRLSGIYTYRGALLDGQPTLDLRQAGEEEGRLMAELAAQLRGDGLSIEDVSVGSTPTAPYAAAVPGVTEIRPGTYIFQDRMQAGFGVCSIGDCAAAVAVTVVSCPAEDRFVIDGGSKTFATDVQPDRAPLYLRGFGHIVEAPGAVLARMTEEHGMVETDGPHGFSVGDVIHVIPNHICSTVNLHNQVYMEENGNIVALTVEARGMVE